MSAECKPLNYSAKVDPTPGTVMGPGMDGKLWRVLGTEWDEAACKSRVTFELVDQDVEAKS